MSSRYARWIAPRSEVESAYEDVALHRNQTPQERLADASRLSRMALGFLERRPPAERARLLLLQEEMDAHDFAVWTSLVRRARAG